MRVCPPPAAIHDCFPKRVLPNLALFDRKLLNSIVIFHVLENSPALHRRNSTRLLSIFIFHHRHPFLCCIVCHLEQILCQANSPANTRAEHVKIERFLHVNAIIFDVSLSLCGLYQNQKHSVLFVSTRRVFSCRFFSWFCFSCEL